MSRAVVVWFAFAGVMAAQPTVAPTAAPADTRGTNVDEYNVVSSIEVGWRFHTVDGNEQTYRADVNFGNGIRLLGSYLSIHSRDGHGKFFDEIVLSTQGLGNDPYENATLRIQKNKLYRYDLVWRQNSYYNPGLIAPFGGHWMDTVRTLQDHDVTILPQSNIRFFVGYSRNLEDGPAISTIQLFDPNGSEFPIFQTIRRETNEYRVGNEIRAFGFRLNWLRGWQDFKEDTSADLSAAGVGNNPAAGTLLTGFTRREPYHGTSPYWRVALFRENQHLLAFNGRFTYTEGRRDFVLDESSMGISRLTAAQQQVLTFGDARRPVATGNVTLSIFAGDRVTITNHASYYNVRTEGDSTFLQYDLGTLDTNVFNYRHLGIRMFANQMEADVRISPIISLFGGYNFTNRVVSTVLQLVLADGSAPSTQAYEQTNNLNAGTAGIRLKPGKPMTVVLEGELGRADHPIYPISDKAYHALRGRLQYRTRTFNLSAYARTNYNFNSTSLTAFSSRSRDYAATAAWTPSTRFGFDAGYSKIHLDTLGGIAYFVKFNLITGDRSYYLSNIHAANVTARFSVTRYADLYVGFSHVQDVGDGRATPSGAGLYSTLPALQAAQTFPLSFDSPLARLSIPLGKGLKWNAGYQFYRYGEQFSTARDYRAHTGFTSLLWSF